MPPPLPPQHYLENEHKKRPLVSPGTWVSLLHSSYYLVPLLLLLYAGWWAYSYQSYPQWRTLRLDDGRSIHAYVEGRDQYVIKYKDGPGGQTSYVSVASLSKWNQLTAQMMPLNLSVTYPLDCTLTKDGKIIHVLILSRSDKLVKITLLSNGVSYLYPLANLSPQDQAWVSMLPLDSAPALDNSRATTPVDPVYIQQLQDRLAQAMSDMRDAKAREAENTGTQKLVYTQQVAADKTEIESLKKKIQAATPQASDEQSLGLFGSPSGR